ncbi:MAG: threonine ammonia-lyase IlvA [Streptococcaceae bacterium]|jgi:threonine dehydratase|nr:threonine ammonia-lyase IlvA [Streptococcaceae bacterium]
MITAQDVEKAYQVLEPVVIKTPMLRDAYLSDKYWANVYLKEENMQRVRSFKLRGAYYAMSQLTAEERARGVVCASAGNHAQGVAYAANEMGMKATIFMPVTTPQQKVGQVQFFGGQAVDIKLVGDTFDESAEAAQKFCQDEGQTFVAPFDDDNVMAGQGTVALEIFEQAKESGISVDELFIQIGGGGLISGVATYAKEKYPTTKIVGVEAAGAKSMQAALDAGYPVTLETINKFADGIAVATIGTKTFAQSKDKIDELVAVDEGLISQTILDLYTKIGLVAEPAGATSVAALELVKDEIKGKTVVCLISGGNNDINRMPEIDERSLVYAGVKHYFVFNFPQRPGALRTFVNDILGPNDDITRFEYIKRANHGTGPVLIGIQLADAKDYDGLLERMKGFDPNFVNLRGNESLYNLLV